MLHESTFKKIIRSIPFLFIAISLQAQDQPTMAPPVKSFALGENLTGLGANSVNLHTGDVALPLNLISLEGHNGLDVAVSIGYSSNVQNSVSTWNLESPAGILGLGWNLNMPKITADHKSTGTREDDEYYIIEGGVSQLLVRTVSGSDADGAYFVYETKNYQFWKIRYYYDIAELTNGATPGTGPNKWVIIKEDGTTYTYGDKNSTRNTVQWIVRWGNWIGNSSQLTGQSQLAAQWNLSEIKNTWNEKIFFEYENVEQFVGSLTGQKHTEASYLKKITDTWGRKVVFFYNEKQAEFYAEPHTEQAEPDAYQEYYEKKYLDHIDVLTETGAKFLSVHFTYTSVNSGTSTAKMLLASVIQKNAAGIALPAMQFEYYTTGDVKGSLKTVTSPSGSTITYTYTAGTPAHSNRQFTATAPAGYAEGRVWIADDYVVVTWRQLGSGGSHDDNARDVKLYAYQWVGEWKEQFLQTIPSVTLEGEDWSQKEYEKFQVTLQRDFFAVLSYGNLYIRWKDPSSRGGWLNYNSGYDYGDGTPTLMSGTNFVAVGSWKEEAGHPSHFYTFQGDTWKDDTYDQTSGEHQYTGTNNYLISHQRLNFLSPPEINFYYLTEDKKWVGKGWSGSLEFWANDPSYWYSSNSMAVVMADDNPEYAYRWDVTYNNFYMDTKDKDNNDLFGGQNDFAVPYIINNSLVGMNGRLARFDGKDWSTASITSTHTSVFNLFFSYGDDFVVRPTESVGFPSTYKGGLKIFNPNTLQWQTDVIMDGADRGRDFASAGNDYYYFGNGFYYRQPNGTWVKKFTYPSGVWPGTVSKGSSPRLEVMHGDASNMYEVRYFKNGELSDPNNALFGRNLLYMPYRFRSPGVGNQTIITTPAMYPEPENSNTIQLNRFITDQHYGSQADYPVTMIAINDGTTTNYVSYDYNYSTAAMDASGSTAQYNEVTEIPGSNNAGIRPFGYTKTFFFNGLTSVELGVSLMTVDLQWNGMPYRKEVYDNNNVLVATTKNAYQTFSRNIFNDIAVKVGTGNYSRLTEERAMTDGIEKTTAHSYDLNTGLVNLSQTFDVDSRNTTARVYYKYFWEQYDINRTKNILTPVIQTKNTLFNLSGETVMNVSATTWKLWNNIFGPHKNYQWRRAGTTDFDFTAWSEAGEPGSNWMKLSTINAIDATGNVSQVTDRTMPVAVLFGANSLTIAKADNTINDHIAYGAFEDNFNGNWTVNQSGVQTEAGKSSITGKGYYNLAIASLTKSFLATPNKNFIVSYWSRSGAQSVNSTSPVSTGRSVVVDGYTWVYYEHLLNNPASITVSGSGIIDELRLYPDDARMITYTYVPLVGISSVCDVNNHILYYEYDDFNRLLLIRGQDRNIVKTYEYHFRQ